MLSARNFSPKYVKYVHVWLLLLPCTTDRSPGDPLRMTLSAPPFHSGTVGC